MSGRRRILAVGVVALLLAACGGTSRRDFDEEIQSRGGGLGSALAVDALAALEGELEDEVALRSFTMTSGQVTMEVLVPGTEDQVDSYRYGTSGLYGGGGLSDPTPVPGAGEAPALRRSLFRPERVAFDEFDRVIDTAIDEADLDGGYAQTLRVDRTSPRPRISVNVTSPRETVIAQFRADGTPLRTGDR